MLKPPVTAIAADLQGAIACNPPLISPNTSIMAAIAAMDDWGTSCVFVVERRDEPIDQRNLIGILTDRDIIRISSRMADWQDLPVQSVMSHPVVTVAASALTDIKTAFALFQRHQISHLPLMDPGSPESGAVACVSGLLTQDALTEILTQRVLQLEAENAMLSATAPSLYSDPSANISKSSHHAHSDQTHSDQAHSDQADSDQAHSDQADNDRHDVTAQLEAQNALLAQIAQNEPLSNILHGVIDAVEQQFTGAICSVLILDQNNRLRHGAAHHLPLEYSQAVDGVPIGDGIGSCGTAAFRRETIIVTDIATDPLWQNYKEIALAYGLRACWSTPILARDGRVLGTFGVYYPEVRSPQSIELATMTQMAHIAGIAIEQEQADVALQEKQTRWQFALEAVGEGLWDWNLESNSVFFSHQWKAMLGYADHEIENCVESWKTLVHPDDLAHCYAALEEHFSGASPLYENEHRLLCKDGSYKWVLDRGKIMEWTAEGKPYRMLGTHTDIGDRKRSQQALQDSEAHQRALIQALPDLITRINREGIYLEFVATPNFPVVGSIPQLVGTHVFDSLPRDVAKKRLDCVHLALETNSIQMYEQDLSIDGKTQVEEVRVVPYNPDEVLLLVRDISARKQVEQQLSRSEAALVEAQHIAHIGSWEFRIQSQTIVWSKELFRMFGMDPSQPEPSYPEYLLKIHPDDRALLNQCIERAIADSIPYTIDYRVILSDGSIRYHEGRGEVERNAQGQVIRLFGTALDITDRKQAERQLQNLVEGTAATTGHDFFPALVSHIATTLNVSYALVTEKVNDKLHALAFFGNGMLQSTFSYHPAKTPCEKSLQDGLFYCANLVQQQFPADLDLVDMKVESYLGIALRDAQGNAIGNLCILNQQPIQDPHRAENLLRVFAARAAAELERERAAQALEQLNRELENKVAERTAALQASQERWHLALKGANDGIWDWNLTTNRIFFSDRWKEMRGFAQDEIGDTLDE